LLAVFAEAPILNDAVDQSEEREVATHSHVLAGMDTRAELADQNISGLDLLAAENLHPASLSGTVASVSSAPLPFLVCHDD
jgi:hypothetical protein